jgi:hypothetical protein
MKVVSDPIGHSCRSNVGAGQGKRGRRERRICTWEGLSATFLCVRRTLWRRGQRIGLANLVKVGLAFREGYGLAKIWLQPPDETSYFGDVPQETLMVITTEI